MASRKKVVQEQEPVDVQVAQPESDVSAPQSKPSRKPGVPARVKLQDAIAHHLAIVQKHRERLEARSQAAEARAAARIIRTLDQMSDMYTTLMKYGNEDLAKVYEQMHGESYEELHRNDGVLFPSKSALVLLLMQARLDHLSAEDAPTSPDSVPGEGLGESEALLSGSSGA